MFKNLLKRKHNLQGKRGGAASLLFFKLDMLLSAAVSPEAKETGRRAKV